MELKRNWKAITANYEIIQAIGETVRCYKLNDRSVQLLLMQMGMMHWKTRWNTSVGDELTPTQLDNISRWVSSAETELLKFNDCVECEDSTCVEYPLNASIITWEPNDPFVTPNYAPPGYLLPPWYVAGIADTPLWGTDPGDVLVNLTSIQGTLPPSGWPRFRVKVIGQGVVELHFVNINTGGYAQITADDDPLSVEFVDLKKDVLSVPPEGEGLISFFGNEIIIERKFETDGDHHIDVLMIPMFNDELAPPLTFGAAVRKIVLCGFDEMYKPCPDPEPCPDCPDPDDIIDDFVDDITDGGDLEDLEMLLDCYRHYPGDIKLSASGQPGIGWLVCDGASYPKTQHPALYAAIGDAFGATSDTFAVPDLRGRAPIGTGQGVDLTDRALGALVGEETHQLTIAEMARHDHENPPHAHEIEPHIHSIPGHTHTTAPHGHTNNPHGHTTQPHTHAITQTPHSHNIDVRDPGAAFGSGEIAVQANTTENASRPTDTADANITIQSANVDVDQNSITIGQTTVTVNTGGAGDTGATGLTTENADFTTVLTGSDDPHNTMQPSIALNFFIFAGCSEGDCE